VLKRSRVKPTVAETKLLELLLSDEQMRRDFLPRLEPSDYEELATAGIFEALLEIEKTGATPDFETLSEKLQDDQQASELLPMLLMQDSDNGTDEEIDQRLAANRYVEALHLMSIERRIKQIVLEITAADNSGDASLRDRLVLEQLNLDRRRKALMPSPDAPVST
jgi:replicative DNA helicase